MKKFVPLFVIALVSLSSVAATEKSKGIEIKTSSGKKTFGYLKEDAQSKTLTLDLPERGSLVVGECSQDVITSKVSADGKSTALVLEKNCGATVDYATHVVLRAKGQDVSVAVYSGRPKISLKWASENELRVDYSALNSDEIFTSLNQALGVRIVANQLPERTGITDQKRLQFASLNYGATGLASGQPEEVLLRIAGWSQQASGLYRKSYGEWKGSGAYGDDPRGHQFVLEGFKYYKANKDKIGNGQ